MENILPAHKSENIHMHKDTEVKVSPPAFQPLSIAPMMRYSTPQMRYLWRQLCEDCLLYTEMQPGAALVGERGEHRLSFLPCEKPLALQVAGHDPVTLAHCARLASRANYDEINFNMGCPSESAAGGCFGAALMKNKLLAANCVHSMVRASDIPVSVKMRAGIDELDDLQYLASLTEVLIAAGAAKIIVHARKAVLGGLSPKQNRTVPPLRPERVYALKKIFPDTPIILNGGLRDVDSVRLALKRTDGVMIGRIAYEDPMFLGELAKNVYAKYSRVSRYVLLEKVLAYANERWQLGEPFHRTGKHLLNLYKGVPGGKGFRRYLTRRMQQQATPPSVEDLLPHLPDDGL